jgi:hypothetical protein
MPKEMTSQPSEEVDDYDLILDLLFFDIMTIIVPQSNPMFTICTLNPFNH